MTCFFSSCVGAIMAAGTNTAKVIMVKRRGEPSKGDMACVAIGGCSEVAYVLTFRNTTVMATLTRSKNLIMINPYGCPII